MFLHNLKYAFKGIIKERTGIFWACMFPFVLGTLFNASFGHINEKAEQFHEIAVGVVTEKETEENGYFTGVLEQLEDESGTKMFQAKELTRKEAKKQLEKEKIKGYYVLGEEISLVIEENGIDQMVLNVFLDNYNQRSEIIAETAKSHPEKLHDVVKELQEEHTFYDRVNESKGNMDNVVQYFYSLVAMSCMFGCFLSFGRIVKLQANLSAVGMRRGASPMKKSGALFSEFFVCLAIQSVIGCLLLFYLIKICGINMGGRVAYMIPVVVIGSAFGVALGVFVGSIGRLSEGVRNALALCISLGLSFLSGLMVDTVKQLIEDTVPILNRINPATLITDALYSLNVFEGLERYYMNLGILTVLTAALCIVSILQTRRTKYASL